jgi:hypothetical protein
MRAAGSRRVRKSSSWTDGRSAHCRSSRITASGRSSAATSRAELSSSNSWNRAAAGGASAGGGVAAAPGSSGSSRASDGASAPCRSRRPSRAASDRSTCTQGQYAGPPSPCQPQPHTASTPRRSASAAARAATVVLPMPASPVSRTSPPWPATASSTARPSRARTSPPADESVGGPGRLPRPRAHASRGLPLRHPGDSPPGEAPGPARGPRVGGDCTVSSPPDAHHHQGGSDKVNEQAEPFQPPAWRAQWVEQTEEA